MAAEQFLRWRVGEVRITRILDVEVSGISFLVPNAVPEKLRTIDWLAPYVAPTGEALAAIQSFVVEADGKRILVDSGAGEAARAGIPAFIERTRPYLADLASAGFPPESIDLVLHTHLHFDHVGWNTEASETGWRPVFPRAMYLVAGHEWARWSSGAANDDRAPVERCIRPLMLDGRVRLVDPGEQLGASLLLLPTPGHTPGHISVRVHSHGAEGFISGDVMHHPSQVAHPDWACTWDDDPAAAVRTRERFLAAAADSGALVIGTHFARAPAGYVQRDGTTYRFVPVPPYE